LSRLELLVGTPVTERGAARLSKLLKLLARRYGVVALPLPRELCWRAAVGSRDLADYARRILNPSGFRVWSSVLETLRELALEEPWVEVNCYVSERSYASSEELGYAIAALVVKARAYGIIKPEEWLEAFKAKSGRLHVEELSKYRAVIADGYSWTITLNNELKPERVVAVDTLIPTPLDLLELIANGYVSRERVREVISYAVRYVGEYILTSNTLTEAYDKLLNDKDYLKLIEELGLEILKPTSSY